jgi:histidine ammonia-lyase
VDPIAALAVEAAGARVDGFDPTLFEILRQHRGQMLSASNLKLLLEGSKRAGSNKTLGESFAEFHSIPQIVGPAQEAIAIATKCVLLLIISLFGFPIIIDITCCYTVE